MNQVDAMPIVDSRPFKPVAKEWAVYRNLFPHTRDRIYLNHAALSPMHRNSMLAVQKHMYARSHDNIEYWPTLLEEKTLFKSLVGKLIGGSEDNIAVTDNTSMGLNWLTRGLQWQPGDRILLNDAEFPSNIYPFLNMQHTGVKIDYIPNRDGRIEIEDIVANIYPETKVLSISFVEFLNGYRNDLATIGRICRDHGIIFCVDGIQGIGAMQIDVESCHIDFLSCGGQKWLMWPLGTAFFYVAPTLFDRLRPMAAGWLSVENSWDFFDYDLTFLPTAARFEPGMFNAAGVVGAISSLELFLELGADRIENRILGLTDYLIDRLEESNIKLCTVKNRDHRSGIVTFYHDRAKELCEFLKRKSVSVSLRTGMVRVAPHFYNTREEIDNFIQLIREFDG